MRSKDVRLIVSTVLEAEHLLPFLLECVRQDRKVNVLYGVPLPPSQAARLGRLASQVGPGSISVMIDHQDQVPSLKAFHEIAKFPAQVFVKVDTGYHRAGVGATSDAMRALVETIADCEQSDRFVELIGFYSHAGDSYGGSDPSGAMKRLHEEISEGITAAKHAQRSYPSTKFVLSVGATPTSTSIQNIYAADAIDGLRKDLHSTINEAKQHVDLEVHAGVYPLLDLQQCATEARYEGLSTRDIALTILTEITSYYDDRPRAEALIAAGSLALGREPCKSYSGWGVVTPWSMDPKAQLFDKWIVGKVSQEHGILVTDSPSKERPTPLKVGQKVRIWPNHACVAGAGFGFYLVVDSSRPGAEQDIIVDVWARWRGW